MFRDGRVEIVAPLNARPGAVARFVAEHRAWIERTQRRARRNAPVHPPGARSLPVPQLELAALCETWRVVHHESGGRARMRVEPWAPGVEPDCAGTLLLYTAADDQTAMRRLLVSWLRERLRAAAHELLPALAATMGTDFAAVRVGCQRSRWGSCSRHGTISLNCCLLFQRPAVLRYLLVHELAHRRHMNHGARFWQHVAAYEPDWRSLDRELSRGWKRVPPWTRERNGGME